MFWWILLGVSAVILIIGIILWIVGANSHKYYDNKEEAGMALTFLGGAIAIIMFAVCIVCTLGHKMDVENFKRQKEYIETVVPTLPNTDNFALTQKRIELNEWLYNAQYSKENYPFFSLYPDEVLELEEIE